MDIQGTVAPGYEAVYAQFAKNVASGLEDGAQLAAYVRGEKVVDLWINCERSSIQNLFSSTKVLTSLVVAMLVDRGHLAYEQQVAEVWPEYAANGKGSTTIGQVM